MRRRRVTLIIAAVVLLILIFSLRSMATFYTEFLWFRELGQTSVFWKSLTSKLGLASIFGLVFFALMWTNLYIADRLAPIYVPAGPEEQLLGRYREVVAPYRRWIRLGLSGILAIFIGAAATPRWSDWLLFLNRVDFGVKDPQFGRDVGFYVFQLPFYQFLVNWFLGSLVFITIITAVLHYVNGGIRFQTARRERVTPAVKAHLSVLFGVLALIKGAGYLLNQYQLLFSGRGFEFARGASATDINAQRPALRLLMIVMVFVAVLFLVNIRFRGWLLPAAALSIWVLVSVVAGGIFPLIYQRVRVQPQEAVAERPFIDRNIRFTRTAFNLDPGTPPEGQGVTVTQFSGAPSLTPAQLSDNAVTVNNVRLWDPRVLPDVYQQVQSLRQFYNFNDVDVDRYLVDVTDPVSGRVEATPQQVLLAVRELKGDALPSKSWVNVHLQFTHGYGIVVSEADTVEPRSGQPNFLLRDFPVKATGTPAQNAALALDRPQIYFGESLDDYAFVRTGQREFDFPQEGQADVETVYEGKAGVPVSNIFVRAAFALRFANVNPLLASQINSGSRVLYHRDIQDRIHTLAPFLALDADPYPAIVNKRIVWIQDGYTVTGLYPYSQKADLSRVRATAHGLHAFGESNYIRNSVKAVVDAYDGTVTLYVNDKQDPVIRSYAQIFPSLFTFTEPSEELRRHFRYPEDLFRVQSNLYQQYHVTDPDQFYRQQDPWSIPNTPARNLKDQKEGDKMEPYYLLMRLPEDPQDQERFVIIQPFTPRDKNNMVSFLVARGDPEGYGRLTDYRLPVGQAIEGPIQVFGRINQQPEISRDLTLLGQSGGGSKVLQGNLLVIPVEESILYVQPIYVQSERQGSQFPQFNSVVVAFGDRVVRGATLDEALTQLFGVAPTSPTSGIEQPVTGTVGPGTGGPPLGAGSDPLVLEQQALEEYRLAQEALNRVPPDLGEYQRRNDRAAELIRQAVALRTGSVTPTVSGSTSPPVPSPSPSPR